MYIIEQGLEKWGRLSDSSVVRLPTKRNFRENKRQDRAGGDGGLDSGKEHSEGHLRCA